MQNLAEYTDALRKIVLATVLTFWLVSAFAGQESTVFRFDGQDFIRVDTTLMTQDGKSAVNTKLDRADPSYAALVQKRSYSGNSILYGQSYAANYAPLTNEQGQLTGAIFVGKGK